MLRHSNALLPGILCDCCPLPCRSGDSRAEACAGYRCLCADVRKCSTLKVAGSEFGCKAVSFYQTEVGRANFTIVLDDPKDDRHIITFSGDNGVRQNETYELPVDRMLLKSKDNPTDTDGLPVATVEASNGKCRQLGSFVTGQISNISCSATDRNGKTYQLEFKSDGAPTLMWHVKELPPTIQ